MRLAPTVPAIVRKHLAVPLAALFATLAGIIVMIHGVAVLPFGSSASGWLITALAAAGMAFGVVLVVVASRSVVRPLEHLADVARAITHGRLNHRVNKEKIGNFEILADAFNRMVSERLESEDRLRAAHDSLELKVQARTVELWKANKALGEASEQRARAERDFLQAQKMDALGKLSGSIAHDFNNLLTVIIGATECGADLLPADHPARAHLATVKQAGERAAGLTKPLLTFSRNQAFTLEPLGLNEAIEEACRMLQRLIGVNIRIEQKLGDELRPVLANATQLQQVLMNLGVNARDAMEGRGVLAISTRNVAADDEAVLRNGPHKHSEWVELTVRDSGAGMDAETKARIFEPYFTTKPVGRGTGLGLATVFGIVRESGGFVEVESEPGEGAAFRIFLPASREAIAVPRLETQPIGTPANGAAHCHATALLVDDEPEIRELAGIMLEGRGFTVLQAASAEDAIPLAEQHCGEINVLITDIIMPGMNGAQLAEVLCERFSDLRVLFVSGHSNDSISAETLKARRGLYLQKPYRGEELAGKVRELMAMTIEG